MLTGSITIPQSKNGEARQVPMNATVRSVLIGLGALRRSPSDPTERVFDCSYRQAAKFFSQAVAQAQRALRDAERDASRLDGYTWHGNRHTFASRLIMAGVDMRAVQELGGWKTLKMVARYGHLSPEHLRSAVERLVAPDNNVAELARN
jgi:site-specific recombinase XerD